MIGSIGFSLCAFFAAKVKFHRRPFALCRVKSLCYNGLRTWFEMFSAEKDFA
jgi:hypothetical protein